MPSGAGSFQVDLLEKEYGVEIEIENCWNTTPETGGPLQL